MNEFIFFVQVFVIIGFALGALRLGKEALVAWVAIQALIANLFVLKQMTLFGLDVTASDAFMIGSLLGLNFLQEYFSREEANRAARICLFFLVFFVFISQLHLLYQPNSYDMTQAAFMTLLAPSPRLFLASLSVFFIVQQVDVRFFGFLKRVFPQLNFSWRAGITLVVSQFLDTILFSFAGLYGIVVSIVDIIFVSFLIKFLVIFCFTSCIKWAKT